MLTHLSLFSGIGGLDIAAEMAGFQTVGQCEWADYPTKVLKKHWPHVPRWRDIRTLTGESFRERTGVEEPTVVSGGFPCQPHSLAGKRLASDDERDLWDELYRVFCETRAGWLVAENVRGLLSSENGRFFGRVLRDLANGGCTAWWYCFPAHAAGATFWGERVAIVAASHRIGFGGWSRQEAENRYRAHDREEWQYRSAEVAHRFVRYISNPPTAPADIRSNYGPSDWAHRLNAIGNMVMPQQFCPIFQAIAAIEELAPSRTGE